MRPSTPDRDDRDARSAADRPRAVLELTVRNHPGVMSHVCGLFARRAFNLEAIVCLPVNGADRSRMWLLVNDDARLPQLEKQVGKLYDVLSVCRHAAEHEVFVRLERFFAPHGPPAPEGA